MVDPSSSTAAAAAPAPINSDDDDVELAPLESIWKDGWKRFVGISSKKKMQCFFCGSTFAENASRPDGCFWTVAAGGAAGGEAAAGWEAARSKEAVGWRLLRGGHGLADAKEWTQRGRDLLGWRWMAGRRLC